MNDFSLRQPRIGLAISDMQSCDCTRILPDLVYRVVIEPPEFHLLVADDGASSFDKRLAIEGFKLAGQRQVRWSELFISLVLRRLI